MRQSLLVLASTAGLMVGCAAAPAGTASRDATGTARPERQCFFPQQIDNFRSANATTLYLKVRGGAVYELSTTGACTDLDNAYRLAIVPDLGASRLCTNEWATVSAPGPAGPLQTCRAHIEKTLTDAEIAALPARYRP